MPVRDLFPKIAKSECTPTSGQEDDLWQLVAGDAEAPADEFGDFSDDEDAGSFAGVDNDWEGNSTGDDQHGCCLPSALLMSNPEED